MKLSSGAKSNRNQYRGKADWSLYTLYGYKWNIHFHICVPCVQINHYMTNLLAVSVSQYSIEQIMADTTFWACNWTACTPLHTARSCESMNTMKSVYPRISQLSLMCQEFPNELIISKRPIVQGVQYLEEDQAEFSEWSEEQQQSIGSSGRSPLQHHDRVLQCLEQMILDLLERTFTGVTMDTWRKQWIGCWILKNKLEFRQSDPELMDYYNKYTNTASCQRPTQQVTRCSFILYGIAQLWK